MPVWFIVWGVASYLGAPPGWMVLARLAGYVCNWAARLQGCVAISVPVGCRLQMPLGSSVWLVAWLPHWQNGWQYGGLVLNDVSWFFDFEAG